MGNMPHYLGQLALTFEKLYRSSAALEREFSTIGFIEDDSRNGFGMKKLEKLTFIKRILKPEPHMR